MTKKTAVEWLVANIDWLVLKNCPWQYEMLIEKAKTMEKEQIVEAYIAGDCDPYFLEYIGECANQYYNDTFQEVDETKTARTDGL